MAYVHAMTPLLVQGGSGTPGLVAVDEEGQGPLEVKNAESVGSMIDYARDLVHRQMPRGIHEAMGKR